MKKSDAQNVSAALSVAAALFLSACSANTQTPKETAADTAGKKTTAQATAPSAYPPIDTAAYNRISAYLANGDTTGRWPVKNQPYPLPGAVLPFHRIVAYYGNLYSKKMGVLGEYPKEEMLKKLMGEVKRWSAADSVVKSIPALHYICVTAQGIPGKDEKYRYRMPFKQIDTILNWAKEINALVFLDVQVGFSTLPEELPLLEKYLAMPNVHLGIDPEFSMSKRGKKPGTVIGTYDAADVNYAANYLVNLVKKNNLPPKILIVHRFTRDMLTNAAQIKLHPEVQMVMDMDGWGAPQRKRSTYYSFIYPDPVQFTGFKLFYKNDTQRVGEKQEMQPKDVLVLRPRPIYIQYQ